MIKWLRRVMVGLLVVSIQFLFAATIVFLAGLLIASWAVTRIFETDNKKD